MSLSGAVTLTRPSAVYQRNGPHVVASICIVVRGPLPATQGTQHSPSPQESQDIPQRSKDSTLLQQTKADVP